MIEQLNLYPLSMHVHVMRWSLYKDGELIDSGKDSIEHLAKRCQGKDRVHRILWIPGEEVLGAVVRSPTRRGKYVSQAVLGLVEEFSAQDIESVHQAVGKHMGDRKFGILMVDADGFGSLIGKLKEQEMEPHAAYADFVGLAWLNDEDVLGVLHDDRCILHSHRSTSGQVFGMAIPGRLLVNGLEHLMQDTGQPVGLRVMRLAAQDGDRHSRSREDREHGHHELQLAEALGTLKIDNLSVREESVSFELVELFREPEDQSFNLCHGRYGLQRPRSVSFGRGWKVSIGLGLICFILFLVDRELETRVFQQEGNQARAMAEDLYRSHFPAEELLAEDLVSRTRQSIAVGKKDDRDDFMRILSVLAEQASHYNDRDLRILSLNYLRSKGEVALEVRIQSFQLLDEFKSRVAKADFNVDISFANQVRDSVQARLQIRAAPATS